MRRACALTCVVVLFVLGSLKAQPPDLSKFRWQQGPSVGNLGVTAEVRVPAGYYFLDGDETRKLLELMQNPTSGRELGLLAPRELKWFAVFEFDDVGYVKDDEKDSLDAEAMLTSMKKGTERGNEERRRRGWPTMRIIGWEQKPHYDQSTHNLEWAVRAESEGEPVVNYNTRLLGRGGVMEVTLVSDPTDLAPALPLFKSLLVGYQFKSGQKYAEFRPGDKTAQYGLAALVVGGAAAVGVKTGLFKYIWKALVVGFFVVVGFFRSLVARFSSR